MKKLTRILSLVLVAVCALMLAACGKTEAPTTTKAPAATTTKPATQAPATTTKPATQAPATTTVAPTTAAPTTTAPVEYYENGLLKGDFENLVQPMKNLTNAFVANWANFSAGSAEIIIETDGNHAIKLLPATSGGAATITGEFGPGVCQAGTLKVSAKVKRSAGFDGNIVFGAWDNSVWTPGYQVQFDLSAVTLSETEWTTITYEYTVTEATTNGWVNFDFGYICGEQSDNNYILVDDITVLVKGTDDEWTKADTCNNNGFEGFDSELILNVNGWKAGSFIYVEADSLENELPMIDGNTVLKVYGTNQKTVKFNLAAGTALALPGDYRVTMKVKLGADATNVSRIAFLFFGAPNPALSTDEAVEFDLTNLTADGWATIDAYFTVTERTTSAWVNMFFMVDLNNDVIQSANNFIYIDDVQICQAK